MKKILKPLALVLAILLITSSVSAAEPTPMKLCAHLNREVTGLVYGVYTSINSSQHHVIMSYSFHCKDCGRDIENIVEEYNESHSFSIDYLVEEYHMGHNHYYVYSASCVCGEKGTTKVVEPCSGPPCNVHQ